MSGHAGHDILRGMALHLSSADRRERVAHAGEEQTQVLVYFSTGANGAAGVAARDLLLDGDSGRNALDVVAFRLVHPAQELPGIRAEALHISPLPLGKQGVEGQTALAAAADARDDDELVARYLERDVLQVVHPDAFRLDALALVSILYVLAFLHCFLILGDFSRQIAVQSFVISPARLLFIISRRRGSGSLWPSRNISLVMAHSGVLSYPLTTPASNSGRLVS